MPGWPSLWELIWWLIGVRVSALPEAWTEVEEELGRGEARRREHRMRIHREAKPRRAKEGLLSALGHQLPPAKQAASGWLGPRLQEEMEQVRPLEKGCL